MCLILISFQTASDRVLTIAANRDEFFIRRTREAHYWHDHPEVFAGRDLEEQGTWLGVTTSGRVAMLTNWTEEVQKPEQDQSRGQLVRNFLTQSSPARRYAEQLHSERYRGFNLVLFDGHELVYTNNRTNEIRTLPHGQYSLTNTRLGDPWPRATNGIRKLENSVSNPSVYELVELLFDCGIEPFNAAPEKQNAPCFIRGHEYGTRVSTAVIRYSNMIEFCEQSYKPMGIQDTCVYEQIPLNPPTA